MILKHFRHLSAALGLLFAQAATASDATFIAAYDAYRAGDPSKFARAAGKLEGHPLTPWLEYWELSMRLEDAEQPELVADVSRQLAAIAAIVRLHFRKEEEVLLPILDAGLTVEQGHELFDASHSDQGSMVMPAPVGTSETQT